MHIYILEVWERNALRVASCAVDFWVLQGFFAVDSHILVWNLGGEYMGR